MKAIMYHYVRYGSESFPYFRYLHFHNFCKQLDYFEKTYGFVSKEDFLESVGDRKNIKGNGVILTFDDGFIDHYQYVFPELQKRNLWGIFYVPTGVYQIRKVLDVHNIHLLLGRFGGRHLLDVVDRLIAPEMLVDQGIREYEELTYHTQDNDGATATFKRIMNYFISYEWRDQLIENLVKECFGKDIQYQEIYMTVDQLTEMKNHGMIIGSHGVNHLVYSKLTREQLLKEITLSFEFLNNSLGAPDPKTFCYPYGQFSCTDEAQNILNYENCLFAFNVESKDIDLNDLHSRPQSLPRYGCHLLPHGKAHMGLQPPQ